jgi:5-methylcytosine-specific restriction endonuclease McrA
VFRVMLKGKVLLLNPHFEALNVVSMERAIRLMLREDNRAYPVLETDKPVRTPQGEMFKAPSVIRLSQYENIRENIRKSKTKRITVYTRDKFTCCYCGNKPGIGKLTLDHVMPASRGGKTEPDNLVTACKNCNNFKADKTPEEAGMKLLKPLKPFNVGIDKVMAHYWSEYRPDWKPYLYLSDTSEGDISFTYKEHKKERRLP